ncbi:zinc finger protein 512 isoform X2 [Pogona vitticeps]
MKGLRPGEGPRPRGKAANVLSEAEPPLETQGGMEDHQLLPRKKRKVPAQQQQMEGNPQAKPRQSCQKKEVSVYPSGSQEELWYQEILKKGHITCPVCRAVARKTVEGLKKHMADCQQEMFTCQHCGKQLRSLAGMKYHLMADHNSLMAGAEMSQMDQQSERDCLRRILKRMGKLRCTREGCTGSFTSVLGYLYHTEKCGKAAVELEKLALRCPHCSKAYRSKAGLAYHLKSEHGPGPFFHDDGQAAPLTEAASEPNVVASGSKVQRKSAKAAAYYLQELASEELVKDWPKRKVLHDLVPDDRKLKYTRPGLPSVSQEVLCKWRSEIKVHKRVLCPNQGCDCAYSSISGLKSHLGSCSLGEFVAGKYQCLLCEKEFVSESGVKYHINTVHAEDWFDVNRGTTKSFEKQVKQQRQQQKEAEQKRQWKRPLSSRSRKRRRPKPVSPKKPPRRTAVSWNKGQASSVGTCLGNGEQDTPVLIGTSWVISRVPS